MHFVYILKSKQKSSLYIGYTNNLTNRLEMHNQGKVSSTKPYIPWKLVYFEAYRSKSEAMHREKNLKLRANAWNQLSRRIKQSVDNSD